MQRALFGSLLLVACDATPALDAGTDAPAVVDVPASVDAPVPVDAPPLGCVTAEVGFPRALGLPQPTLDGVFDPDLVRDPATGRLWVSYSAVDGAPGSGRVSTHLAYSDDDGATWCHEAQVNAADVVPAAALPADVTGSGGHWNHETSALVFDPDAPAAERWRLWWHRYLYVETGSLETGRRFEHGWIAERAASTPEGLATAPERKRFSASLYHATPAIEAWNDAAPGGAPIQRLDAATGLSGCLAFAEPALLPAEGELVAAIFCARSATDRSIELVVLDRATDVWSQRGQLLTATDATLVGAGFDGLNAAELVPYLGAVRLLVTPTAREIYRGCAAFDVDLGTGTLVDAGGDGPDLRFFLPLGETASAPFGGACSYVEGSALGLLYSELRTSRPAFNVVASGTAVLGDPP